jgi:hypothetical protein
MKALTVHQPHAALFMTNAKPWEFRLRSFLGSALPSISLPRPGRWPSVLAGRIGSLPCRRECGFELEARADKGYLRPPTDRS